MSQKNKKKKQKYLNADVFYIGLFGMAVIITINIAGFLMKNMIAICFIIIMDIVIYAVIRSKSKWQRFKDPQQKIAYIQKLLQKGRMSKKRAFFCNNQLSINYYETGDLENALKYNEIALELLKQTNKSGNNRGRYLINRLICLLNKLTYITALDKGDLLEGITIEAERVYDEYDHLDYIYKNINTQYFHNVLTFAKAKAALNKADIPMAQSYCDKLVTEDAAFDAVYQNGLRYDRMLLDAEMKLATGDTKMAMQLLEQVITLAPNQGMVERAKILQKRIV